MQVGFLQYNVLRTGNQNIDCISVYLQRQKCDLPVLPELSMCGYLFENREDLFLHAEAVPSGPSTQRMLDLSRQYSCTIVFGLAEESDGKLFNTAVIVSKGKYVGRYRKIHLSDFEKKFFDTGEENQVFEVDGITIGVQICFDLWFPEISREQRRMGADILCVLANFGGATTYQISKIRAIENLRPLVLCNRVGTERTTEMDVQFLGKSTMVEDSGHQIYTAPGQEAHFAVCNIAIERKNANVICSNFDDEIAFHYKAISNGPK